MGGNDGWITKLGIGHILSLIVTVMCVLTRDDSINNNDAMMYSHTPVK